MKAISFKKAIESLGLKIERYSKGFNFRSAWARDSEGQLWYYHIEDLRDSEPGIFRRTAESVNDYTGGTNRWDVKQMVAELGYRIVESRGRKDFNSL